MTREELLKTLLTARKHAGEVWAMLVDVPISSRTIRSPSTTRGIGSPTS
jgi:hypothetical protein